MANDHERDEWAAVASTAEFLAFSFRYPGLELAQAVHSGEWFAAACEIGEMYGCPIPGSEIRAQDGSDSFLHGIRREATRMFLGPHEPPVSIYEGIWSARDRDVAPLLFVSPAALAVERFCKQCGLGRPGGTNESLDHAATELEVLQYLASVEAGIVVPAEGSVSAESLPGGSASAAYRTFFEEHIAAWMPRFADAVSDETKLDFYLVSARLLKAFLTQETDRLAR